MSRNYSNAEKRKWTDKYVHEHHAYDKKNRWICECGVLSTIDMMSL